MFRLALLLVMCCAPLAAVAPTGDTLLELEAASLDISISAEHGAVVRTSLTVRNPAEAAEFEFELADALVPEDQRKEFALSVNAAATTPIHSDHHFRWSIKVEGKVEFAWTVSTGSTALPHRHALGRRELTVRLAHLRKYAALPAQIAVNIAHSLPAELFGREDAAPFSLEHDGGRRIADYTLGWFESTLKSKRAKLDETLESINAKQRTAQNRQYTHTLAHLVDLATLAGDHGAVATHCEALAALEAAAGQALTLCGPWAEWRRYVPWQLQRLRALEALAQDAKACAAQAVSSMAERWPAYLKARKAARPFDDFAERFGVYWDYDWTTTRDLYARALEISGDAEAGKAVRSVE
jgi:hypothetical protein